MSFLGIDLGITKSVISVYDRNKCRVISSSKNTTPTFVSFPQEGEPVVGKAAKELIKVNPENTIYDVKRIIGKSIDDKVLKEDIKTFPFRVESNESGHPFIVVKENGKEKRYSPEEISSFVLKSLVKAARESLGDDSIKDVVITVPAKFGEAQRRCIKKAGIKAGLNVVELLSDPIAAAIAYGVNEEDKEHTVLVFDLGGGTFDVTIIQIEDGLFDVISIDGDEHLGGEDFDRNLMNYIADKFDKENGTDILSNTRARMLLKLAAEETKIQLSSSKKAVAECDCILNELNLKKEITRSEFEDINMEYFNKIIPIVRRAIKNARETITKNDITDIILVGGSSHIPYISKLLKDEFPDLEPLNKVNPDEAVSIGAAIECWSELNEDDDDDDVFVVADALESSYGFETKDLKMIKLFNQNQLIPCETNLRFTTTKNFLHKAEIPIFAGESDNTKENRFIGQINITNIPRKRKGEVDIDLRFIITEKHLLKVKVFIDGVERTDENDFFITDREAPPAEPQRKKKAEGTNSIDILFCIGAAGGMTGWLRAAKKKINKIAEYARLNYPDVYFRFGFVLYKDPVDVAYEKNVYFDLTDDIESLKSRIESTFIGCGGDPPNDWVGCFNIVLNNISWDDDSRKVIIHIASTPAHGESWGGHCKHQDQDPLLEPLLRKIAKKGVFYSGIMIGSLPEISFERTANIFKSEGAKSIVHKFNNESYSAGHFLKEVANEAILLSITDK